MLQTRFTVARRENVFVFLGKSKKGFHYGGMGGVVMIDDPWPMGQALLLLPFPYPTPSSEAARKLARTSSGNGLDG
jgi:hypothetical protein